MLTLYKILFIVACIPIGAVLGMGVMGIRLLLDSETYLAAIFTALGGAAVLVVLGLIYLAFGGPVPFVGG